MELEGRVALITGGGSGIGAATARLFSREGARVGLVGRTKEKLDEVVREIEADGGEAAAFPGDVSDPEDVQRIYRQLEERWERLDVVFAHAGVNGVWAPLGEIEDAEWRKTIAINLTGTFFTVKYALPLLKRRGGAVVITASVNGTRMFSNVGASAYAASKAGQLAFMQMAALELAPDGIRVNAVCPGAIETEIEETTERRDLEKVAAPVTFPNGKIPLTRGKSGSAEQVAQLVLFLASDRADHITGTPVWIDGAQSLLQG